MKNKKLFAILTLVAFMLTMMPVMAFGAASVQSAYGDVEKASVLAPNGEAKFSLTIPNYDATADSVRVFFTVANTNEILAPTTVTVSVNGATAAPFTPDTVLAAGNTFDFVVKNANPGQFDVHAYIVKGTGHASISAAKILNGYKGEQNDIITNAIAWDTDNTLTFRAAGSANALFDITNVSVEDGTPLAATLTKLVLDNGDEVTTDPFTVPGGRFVVKRVYSETLAANNGLYYYEVTGKLTKNNAAVKNTAVTAEFDKVGAFVNNDAIETNARGIFKFNVYASKAGVYTLNLSADGAEDLQLVFNFDSSSVDSVVPTPVTGHFATGTPIYVDLTVKDANGNVLSAADAIAEFVAEVPREFVVVKSPEDSTTFVADDDVTFGTPALQGATGTFTATVNPTTGNAALRITVDAEGDYTFKMYEDETGRDVQYINVSAKKFVKAVQASVAYKSNTYYLGSEVNAPTITLIDANGTKSTLENNNGVEIAYTGVGVTNWVATGNNAGAFKVVNDEKFLGKEIVVTAVADKCFATTTLKIADAPAYLQFTEVTAPVGTEATVPVVSLDLNGGMAALGSVDEVGFEVTPVVTSKPANAIVSVDANSNMGKFATTGKGAIKVASNKPGTVTVNVIVKADTDTDGGSENWVYLTGIATVNFGDEATPVQQSATLIIGSNVFVANGGVQTAPAAPVIIDGRTYLPIRAVGQAIGAQVAYVDGVITLTLGAQKATMVPGSNVMTIGTETVTMDAAPYLAGDGHTMVPVRYAAQAFGYELGTTTNADGSVATVTVFK